MVRWAIAIALSIVCGVFAPMGLNSWFGLAPAIAASSESISALRTQAFSLTQAGQFDLAETYWTKLLDQLPNEPALWSNRGNVKVSQNKIVSAIADYTQAIQLAPFEPDPYLNRGAAYEAQGDWQAALDDYNQVLALSPNDPAGYNNRGNAQGGAGNWQAALEDYQRAIEIDPRFSLGYGNYALALYQVGQTQKAIQVMRSLVRKYPTFVDMRAALTAALWETGQRGEAESNWVAAVGLDSRYKDIDWVTQVRRWPPAMVTALNHFLHL
ncbi:MAG: tetratricopeptide repeat protein [Cyanobacteria bacterium P01_A01_bin.114]